MRHLFIGCAVLLFVCAASAQTPPLNDAAQQMIGTWEFSNAERNKSCSLNFTTERSAVGHKLAFDPACVTLFPPVANIIGWKYPDNDLLYLLNAEGQALVEFSEVEDGIFEAPTPGLGVLLLQNPGADNAPSRTPEQVAGNWALKRGDGVLCSVTLSATPAGDGFALTVQPGCAAAIVKLALTQWRLDRGELLLVPATGAPWRFEAIDDDSWARLPEGAEQMTLVRQ